MSVPRFEVNTNRIGAVSPASADGLLETAITTLDPYPVGDRQNGELPSHLAELGGYLAEGQDGLLALLGQIGLDYVQSLLIQVSPQHDRADYFVPNQSEVVLTHSRTYLCEGRMDEQELREFEDECRIDRIGLLRRMDFREGYAELRRKDRSGNVAVTMIVPKESLPLASQPKQGGLSHLDTEERANMLAAIDSVASSNDDDSLVAAWERLSELMANRFEAAAMEQSFISTDLPDASDIPDTTDPQLYPDVKDDVMQRSHEPNRDTAARVFVEVGKIVGDDQCGLQFVAYEGAAEESIAQLQSRIGWVQQSKMVSDYQGNCIRLEDRADRTTFEILALQLQSDLNDEVHLELVSLPPRVDGAEREAG